jgi:hypothetical protein
MTEAAAAVPSGAERPAPPLPAAAVGRKPAIPTMAPARINLCFARTALGDEQVKRGQPLLPLHVARLLLLFEGPQTVHDLRQMIDEPWLPEAVIELERRRLIQRISPPAPRDLSAQDLSFSAMRLASEAPLPPLPRAPAAVREDAGGILDRRRALTRVLFLRQLGSLGSDMARRIDQCSSDGELDELMPQVDALIEAIAGHDALGQFRQQTTRSS